MAAVHQGQRLVPQNIRHLHFTVEMREQGAAARHFPFQRIAQRASASSATRINPSSAVKCLAAVSAACAAVEKCTKPSVTSIGAPVGLAMIDQHLPFGCPEYLVYQHVRVMPPRAAPVKASPCWGAKNTAFNDPEILNFKTSRRIPQVRACGCPCVRLQIP